MEHDPWHYSRTEFVAHILNAFELEVTPRISIFAPRQMGKTWFVLRDLAPAAIEKSYVPVYAPLWSNPEHPHKAIIIALYFALDELKKGRISWVGYLEKLRFTATNVFGIGGSLMPRRYLPLPSEEISAIKGFLNAVVDAAAQKKRRVLLVVDEAQHLATQPAFDSIAKSFRTAIEILEATQPNILKTVFTGSSRAQLARLLDDPRAAFYHSFYPQELPDLDKDYTDFVGDQLKKLGDVHVSKNELWKVFEMLHRSPQCMQLLINELMLRRADDLDAAYRTVTERVLGSPELRVCLLQLNDLEQALLLRISKGASVYTQEALRELQRDVDESVQMGDVKNAMRRLVKKDFVSKVMRGEYRIDDHELLMWLSRQQ